MINRRDFLKLSGAGIAALFAATHAKSLLHARAYQSSGLRSSSSLCGECFHSTRTGFRSRFLTGPALGAHYRTALHDRHQSIH